ncbi:MAG: UvrD-helicase domain-containing protein [Patescibacteria group bacterium]|nr:UvrD-helicase domain-containing protein [Patescibacteria group bacterium]
MSRILENLNEKQVEAVTHFKGPLLVISGPGSGKTRVLTHRITYLIEEHGVNPWNILAVTFTNKAANEMKGRIIKLTSQKQTLSFDRNFSDLMRDQDLPTVGTFHSVCVRILRKNLHLLDYENNFAIYDEADQQVLMKKVMKDMNISDNKFNPRAVLSHISNAKNQLIDYKKYRSFANTHFTEKVAEIYEPYQKALQQNNALDFDDIIMQTVELFKKHPEVLEHYQGKFQFILVDEYQDTNHAQYVLINMLAEKYRNICVIGDEDQSIYSWRGATIQNILDFEKDYAEAKTIKLEQNYRSTQTILTAATEIIRPNRQRKEKKLWTERGGGDKIQIRMAENERHESETVANEIFDILRSYEIPNYNDFVVLYRTNAQSRVVEEVFLKYGIPYKIVGGIRFYERKEVKDMIAYLRAIQNPNDSVSLLRIINVPPRKIGAKTIETIQSYAQRHNLSFYRAMCEVDDIDELNEGKVQAIKEFTGFIKSMQKSNEEFPASGLIKHVFENSGYKKFLDDGSVEGESRTENIFELMSVAAKYDKLEPLISLNIFLEEISLIADIDSVNTEDNSVTLMTMHSAKGLEFPYVFIVGLEEGVFPHSRSMLEPLEMEEERRLMYVATTRAMEKLYLLHARERMLYGEYRANAPSQFFDSIPEDLRESNWPTGRMHIGIAGKIDTSFVEAGKPIPTEGTTHDTEFADGDKVTHPKFGEGIVVQVTGGIVAVAFKDPKFGVKKLAISIAPLSKI